MRTGRNSRGGTRAGRSQPLTPRHRSSLPRRLVGRTGGWNWKFVRGLCRWATGRGGRGVRCRRCGRGVRCGRCGRCRGRQVARAARQRAVPGPVRPELRSAPGRSPARRGRQILRRRCRSAVAVTAAHRQPCRCDGRRQPPRAGRTARTPSTLPAASTGTTPPHGPDTRRTYGRDHLAASATRQHGTTAGAARHTIGCCIWQS
jgi:hypothetical protein